MAQRPEAAAPYIPDTSHDSRIASNMMLADSLHHVRRGIRFPARISFVASGAGGTAALVSLIATGSTGVGLPIALTAGGLYLASVVGRTGLHIAEKRAEKRAVKEAKATGNHPSELAGYTRLMKDTHDQAARTAVVAAISGGLAVESALAHHAAVQTAHAAAAEAARNAAAVKLGLLKAGSLGLAKGVAAKVTLGAVAKGTAATALHLAPWGIALWFGKKHLDSKAQMGAAREASLALSQEIRKKERSSRRRS